MLIRGRAAPREQPALDLGAVDPSLFKSLVLERESLVVDTHGVWIRGIQVVKVDRITNAIVTEVAGLDLIAARPRAAGHPGGEAAAVVIAARIFGRRRSLRIDRVAEFAARCTRRELRLRLSQLFHPTRTAESPQPTPS